MIEIVNNAKVSAIYFGLLRCGYDDYYATGKEQSLVDELNAFRLSQGHIDTKFLSEVRQNTCAVYPFWPRAFALEIASFFIDPDQKHFVDFDAYYQTIMSAANVQEIERNDAFWVWVKQFPQILSGLIRDRSFDEYLEWETAWIARQHKIHQKNVERLSKALSFLVERYNSPFQNIRIILCPIKCAYSADYHTEKGTFFSILGAMRLESVMHEFLHTIIHPIVNRQQQAILSRDFPITDMDSSYFLGGGERGKLNAFEELMVRTATQAFVDGRYDLDLDSCLYSLLHLPT